MKPSSSRLADQVASLLCAEIVSERIPSGAPIPSEGEIVAQYDVSKVVAREAIQQLVLTGVVSVRQGRRSLVNDRRSWDFLSPLVQRELLQGARRSEYTSQVFEARALLEPVAAELCTVRASEAEVEELLALVQEMELVAATTKDVREFLAYDSAFHAVIVGGVGNDFIRVVIRDLHRLAQACWADSLLQPGELSAVAGEHASIANAIRDRSPQRASEAMRSHLESAGRLELATRRPALLDAAQAAR